MLWFWLVRFRIWHWLADVVSGADLVSACVGSIRFHDDAMVCFGPMQSNVARFPRPSLAGFQF